MTNSFITLLGQIKKNGTNTAKWVSAAKNYFAEFIKKYEILQAFEDSATIVLHGSTTHNIDDAHSDLDFWLVLDEREHEQFRSITEQSFIPVTIDGKTGHINPLQLKDLSTCFGCQINMNLIFEVSSAVIIEDRKNCFEKYITSSNMPISDKVRYAFFFYNYVQMRAFHRSCDNPMARNDKFAVMYNTMNTIKYALQAAFVLDKLPYPYEKWLYVFANFSDTPKSLLDNVNAIIQEIMTNSTALFGPEDANKINLELRTIRNTLINKARQNGIDELWLEKWWRFIDNSKSLVNEVCWTDS